MVCPRRVGFVLRFQPFSSLSQVSSDSLVTLERGDYEITSFFVAIMAFFSSFFGLVSSARAM